MDDPRKCRYGPAVGAPPAGEPRLGFGDEPVGTPGLVVPDAHLGLG